MRKLSKSNSHIRRVVQLNKTFRLKKCRLRLNNSIRWSTLYLVLESVKRAYDRKAFNSEIFCQLYGHNSVSVSVYTDTDTEN